MNCDTYLQNLDDWLDGDLESSTLSDFLEHRNACPSCRRETQFAQQVLGELRELPTADMPEDLPERLLAPRSQSQPRGNLARFSLAAGFCLAIVSALLVTSLDPESPTTSAAQQWVSLSLSEPKNVTLALAANSDIEQAQLTLELPEGVELSGYPGQRELRWTASLHKGTNRLTLPLIANVANDTELLLRVEHGDKQRILRIGIQASAKPYSMDANLREPAGITV